MTTPLGCPYHWGYQARLAGEKFDEDSPLDDGARRLWDLGWRDADEAIRLNELPDFLLRPEDQK